MFSGTPQKPPPIVSPKHQPLHPSESDQNEQQQQQQKDDDTSTVTSIDSDLHLTSSATSPSATNASESPSPNQATNSATGEDDHDLIPTPDRGLKSRKTPTPIRSISPKESVEQRIHHQIIRLHFFSNSDETTSATTRKTTRKRETDEEDEEEEGDGGDGGEDEGEYVETLVSFYRNRREMMGQRMRKRHLRFISSKHTDPLPRNAIRLAHPSHLI